MIDYFIKIDFLYIHRVNDSQILVNYRTNLHSNYFYIKDRLIDLYDIINIIYKIEYNIYYKCFPIIDDESED